MEAQVRQFTKHSLRADFRVAIPRCLWYTDIHSPETVLIRKFRKESARMRRSVLISFLSLLLVCICVSSGLADARKLNLIFIGGDSDTEEGKNNLFRNMMISHEAFQEGAEAFFIKSAGRDYSNAAAIERTKAAEALLEDGSLNVVGGYSHGGQSAFFADVEADRFTDIFLLDACVSIGGKCSDVPSKGRVWAQWVIDTARKGVNIHLFASIGKHNEASGQKTAISNLEKAAKTDDSLIALVDGKYWVLDEDGNPAGIIETGLLEGNHKTICNDIEDHITEYLYTLLE